MIAKGKAIAMAANGRNQFVIRGVLQAAQRANAPVIIEIAKSEGGTKAYCAVNYLEYGHAGRCHLQRAWNYHPGGDPCRPLWN